MKSLSTNTYYRRHKRHAALLLGLSAFVTVGLYSMVALVWGVFVEPGRLAYMTLSKFSLVTPQHEEDGRDFPVVAQIRANPDVVNVIPTTAIRMQLPGIMPGENIQFDLLGLGEEDVTQILEKFEATLMAGQLPRPGTNELLISKDVATMMGVKVGDTYDVISSEFHVGVESPLEPTPFEVTGILKSSVELGIVSLEFLRDHEQYGNFPARFLVMARESREAAVDEFLRNEIQSSQTAVLTLSMLNERILAEAVPGLVMILPVTLIVAIAFSLVIVVVNQIANARRLAEFGILHAIGHSKRWLVRRLTIETATLALVGWVLGSGLSWLALYLLKVTYFASRGHDFDYIAWLPIVATLPIPAAVMGFTFISVRRTFSHLDPVAVIERGEMSLEAHRKQERTASRSSRKPLAPATFYGRHRRRAVMLISGMSFMIVAVVLFIFALAVDADAQEPLLGYLSQVSIVRAPGIAGDLDPGAAARVKAHPAVEQVIPVAPRNHMLAVYIPPFRSAEASPFGVYAEDMGYLVELYGLELKTGHLPRPNTNEVVIPEDLALNRDLEVGDAIGDPERPAYPGATSLDTVFVISGIFARPTRAEHGSGWGFISLEFLETHQPFSIPDSPSLIVVPKAGQKEALDDWLENELSGVDASVLTYRQELSRVRTQANQSMLGMVVLQGIIAIVAAMGLAVLNHIYAAQRQSEFGVLHALGFSRPRLIGRVVGETAFTTGLAWLISAVVVLIGMLTLRSLVFAPRGLTFDLFNITPWLYTLPIPIIVLTVVAFATARTLSKLDPISIIETRSVGY